MRFISSQMKMNEHIITTSCSYKSKKFVIVQQSLQSKQLLYRVDNIGIFICKPLHFFEFTNDLDPRFLFLFDIIDMNVGFSNLIWAVDCIFSFQPNMPCIRDTYYPFSEVWQSVRFKGLYSEKEVAQANFRFLILGFIFLALFCLKS